MIADIFIFAGTFYLIAIAIFTLWFVFFVFPEWLMNQRPSAKRKEAACDRIMRTYTKGTYADQIPDEVWSSVPLAQMVDSEYFDADGYFRRNVK